MHPSELQDTHHRSVKFRGSRSGNGFPYAMRNGGESLKIHGRHVLSIDDGNAYLAAGLAGVGVLWLPAYMAREHVAKGALVPLFEDWLIEPMPLCIGRSRRTGMSAECCGSSLIGSSN